MKLVGSLLVLILSFSAASHADDTENYNSGLFTSNINVVQGYVAYITWVPSLNPWSQGGFQETIKGPAYRGYVWKNLAAVFVDVRPQTYTEDFELQTKDNLQIPFRVHVLLSPDETRVRELVENYSVDWYARSVKESIRTIVRQSVMNYDLKALQENSGAIGQKVENEIRERIVPKMPVLMHSVEIGQFLNPKVIAEAVEQKLAAVQRLAQRDTELDIANKNIEIAKSNGLAQKIAEEQMRASLTPEYLQFLAIEAMREMSKNSNSSVVLMPMSPNGMPLSIPMPQLGKQDPVPVQRN